MSRPPEPTPSEPDAIRLRRWSLLCPHHRVRAALELKVEGDGLVLVECSARELSAGGRCDQRCLRVFTSPEERP